MRTVRLQYLNDHHNILIIALLASLLALLALALPSAGQAVTQIIPWDHSNWKYEATGTALDGTGWQNAGYDDSLWPVGQSVFGWNTGAASGGVEALPPGQTQRTFLGPWTSPQQNAFYFRTTFEWTGDTADVVLTASNLLDDGAVIWLNGQEAGRVEIDPTINPVLYSTSSTRANDITGRGQPYDVVTFPSGLLQTGINTLAVELHQGGTASSDAVFGMQLYATIAYAPRFISPTGDVTIVVEQGRGTNLTVSVDAVPAAGYQWFKDAQPLTDATNNTYTVSDMNQLQQGSYYCVASNTVAGSTSPVFDLVYDPDDTPPTFVSAVGDSSDLVTITVTFSENMAETQLRDPFNWVLESLSGGLALGVYTINFGSSSNILILNTDPRSPTEKYQLTIYADMFDYFTNTLPAFSLIQVRIPVAFQQGVNGYTGTQDTEIHENTDGNPTAADTPGGTSGGPDAASVTVDNDDPAGTRSRMLLRFNGIFGGSPGQIPLGSAVHRATLRVSTINPGSNPILVFKMLVDWNEATTTWNSLTNGIDDGTNGVEAVFLGTLNPSDSPGVDDVDVTAVVQQWSDESSPNYGFAFVATGTDGWDCETSESGTVANRPRLLIDFTPVISPCEITEHPQPATVNEGEGFTLSVLSRGSDLTYQWFKGAEPILGATASSYTVGNAKPSLHDGSYTVQVNNSVSPEPCVGGPAIVTVNPDTTAPHVVSAVGNPDQTTILITFDDLLEAASAQSATNYALSGGLNITTAVMNGTTVTLTSDPRVPGASYSLTIQNVKDDAEAGNTLDPNPTVIGTLEQHVRLLAFSSTWKYHNEGQDLGTGWKEVVYDDSLWPTGQALLALETSAGTVTALNNQNLFINTPLNRINASGTTNITDYFRTMVNVPFSLAGASIRIRHVTDDGGVFYFNGAEAARFNMPTGAVDYLTAALTAPTEGLIRTISEVNGLTTGDNTIAVSVHQTGIDSSDVVFGMELLAIFGVVVQQLSIVDNLDGTVTINSSGPGTLYGAPTLTGPWTLVGSTYPVDVPASETQRFFEIRP